MRYELRPYQISAIERTRDALRAGRRRPLIVAPTGAGKTVIASSIIESANARGSRVLFLAHRRELIDQTVNKLADIGLTRLGVISGSHDRSLIDYAAPVQVGSVQTFIRRMHHNFKFDLIVIDEAHHAKADTYMRVIDALPKAVVIGLTATPYRADGRDLGDLFDSHVTVATIRELVDWGFLVRPRVLVGETADMRGARTTAGDWNIGDIEARVNTKRLIGNVVEQWRKHADGLTTAMFAATIDHSRNVVAEFTKAGIRAEHLDGSMPTRDREGVLARMATGETLIVVNVGVLTEGWDLPRCGAVALLRPTQSRGLWRQMAGRGLRTYPGKTECLILDHAGCHFRHGSLLDPDPVFGGGATKAESKKTGPRMVTCEMDFCGARFRPQEVLMLDGKRHCPMCRTPISNRHWIECVEGELVEVDSDATPRIDPGFAMVGSPARRELFREIAEKFHAEGKEPVKVCAVFKKQTGAWPNPADMDDSKVRVVSYKRGKDWIFQYKVLEAAR